MATVAIVRVQNRPAVDVWVSDRITGKTLVKRVEVSGRATPDVTSALAIHAVELLRASLLEVRTQSRRTDPQGGTGPSPIPNEVAEWVDRAVLPEGLKPIFQRPTIAIGAAALFGPAGMKPAFGPALRVSVGAPYGFAGRLSIVGPGFAGELRGPSGTAQVRQELALAEWVYAPLRRWLSPIASVGVGAYHLHVQGQSTDAAYDGARRSAWAFLADVGIGVAARMGTGAAVTIDVHGFVTQPAERVAIGETSIATLGRPSLMASIGLLAGF
jgi:hypothetical protein